MGDGAAEPRRDFTHDACFVCGGARFTWGRPVLGGRLLQYQAGPEERPVVSATGRTVGVRPVYRQPRDLVARRCETCGNVQVFDPSFVGKTP